MKITNNNNIVFKAKYISKSNVLQKVGNNNNYLQKEVSFVKLNPKSIKDRLVMEKISLDWNKKGDHYTYSIKKSFNKDFRKYDEPIKDYFAIINKKKSSNIMKNNLLGLIQLEEDSYKKSIFIDYLQVNPDYIKNENKNYPDFKNIGLSLIFSVFEYYKDFFIELLSTDESLIFYNKIGFESINEYLKKNKFCAFYSDNYLILNKDKFFEYLKNKKFLTK